MGMAWPRALSSSWLNVEALTCFGSFFLSLLWWPLVTCSRDLVLSKASRKGRECLHGARLLLFFLLFFSSFSFASSSISGLTVGSGPCSSSGLSGCTAYCDANFNESSFTPYISNGQCDCGGVYFTLSSCSSTCTVPSGVPIGEIGSSLTPNADGVIPNTFCNPSDDCDTESFSSSAGYGGSMTNGQACFVTSPTSSTSSSSSSCPSGYSPADSSGCVCSDSSGSFVPSNNSSTNPSCNGGSSTAPTLSPVSPVTSNGSTSCPSGSATVTSGSSTSCFQVVYPPAVNQSSSGSIPSGGGGGSSSFHTVSPVTSSNGQLTCPPGTSSISGSGGSGLTCIAYGSGTPGNSTSPTSSGTSPTASTSSGQSYPTSISLPSLPSSSVVTSALSTIPGALESTSQSCPSPVTFTVMSHTFSITFTYACSLAAKVRPIVIGVFSMASLLLIVK